MEQNREVYQSAEEKSEISPKNRKKREFRKRTANHLNIVNGTRK